MIHLFRNWKWSLACALLALAAGFVAFWPVPGDSLEAIPAAPAIPDAPPTPAADQLCDHCGERHEIEPQLSYRVQSGDSVASIARLFVVPESTLRHVNGLADEDDVSPSMVLLVPEL